MFNPRFLLVAGLLTTTNFVSALESCADFRVIIDDQSDIDFYASCNNLTSMFFIDHSFAGPFELPGVKSLGQFSAGYLGPKLKGSNQVDDGVTSVSMPDLEAVGTYGMLFGYINNLTSISFPKLNTINGDLVVSGNSQVKKLELPALSNITGGVLLWGNFNSINLPNLKTVGYMNVQSSGDLDCIALGRNLSSLTFTPKKNDLYKGFTCQSYEHNSYNSSDPAQNSQSASSSSYSASSTGTASASPAGVSSVSSTGVASASPSASAKSEAGNAVHVRILNVLLCSIAVATFGGLVM